jgi:hypothetical protein
MLTARIGNVEAERAEIERRETFPGTAAPAAGAGTGRAGTPAAEFSTEDRGAAIGAGVAGATRDEAQAAWPSTRPVWPRPKRSCANGARRCSRRSRRGVKRRKNCARRKVPQRNRPGASPVAGAPRRAGPTRGPARERAPGHAAPAQVRVAALEATADETCTARSPATFPVQAGYEAPLALLLGDAVNALILNDDAAAQAWREKLAGKEQCAFAPLKTARPTPLPSSAETHATRFLTAQPVVSDLVAALLEDAHVVDDLAAGWKLKAAQPQSTDRDAGRGADHAERPAAGRAGSGRVAGRADAAIGIAPARGGTAESGRPRSPRRRPRSTRARRAGGKDEPRRTGARGRAGGGNFPGDATPGRARRAGRRGADRPAGGGRHARDDPAARAGAGRPRAPRTAARSDGRARRPASEAEARMADSNAAGGLASEEEAQTNALTESRIELATQTQQCEAWQQQREPVANRLQELRELVGCAPANPASTSSASSRPGRKSPPPSASAPKRARRSRASPANWTWP